MKYIPKYGDRIAAIAFSQKQKYSTNESGSSMSAGMSTRKTIVDRITAKMSTRSTKLSKNQNARKDKRKIELGWFDFDYSLGEYKQIRATQGGGTKTLSVQRNTSVKDLVSRAKNLFFPNGTCKKGNENDFEIDDNLRDYNLVPIPQTISEVYESKSVKILRLYFCTRKRKEKNSVDATVHQAMAGHDKTTEEPTSNDALLPMTGVTENIPVMETASGAAACTSVPHIYIYLSPSYFLLSYLLRVLYQALTTTTENFR